MQVPGGISQLWLITRPNNAPIVAIIAAQSVIFAYDLVSMFAVTAGIVNSDKSNTIPMMRMAKTIVIATTMISRYDMVRVAMPWLAAKSRSNAIYIICRHHIRAPTTHIKVKMPRVITS